MLVTKLKAFPFQVKRGKKCELRQFSCRFRYNIIDRNVQMVFLFMSVVYSQHVVTANSCLQNLASHFYTKYISFSHNFPLSKITLVLVSDVNKVTSNLPISM